MSDTKNLPELSKEAQVILDSVKTLSVMDLANLVKHLEEEFGVSAAAPVAVAAGGAAGGEEAAEQTEFTVVLTAAGASKIGVIKAVREITGLGLKEAKAVVDGAPAPVKEGVAKDEAAKILAQLTEAGATAEIK